jgi:5-methylcytosine-specific restriction endonuclease McrA
MNYIEQLQTIEWKLKRVEILKRDNFKCKNCNSKRSPFLRLSSNYGIKSYYTLKEHCVSFFIDYEKRTVDFLDLNTNFINNATIVSELEGEINLEDLKFALQKDEFENKRKLICFTENIDEKDNITDLNIHHKYYTKGNYAWEYDNDALITFCKNCHQEEHQNNKIPIYDNMKNILSYAEICDRCNGSGFLPQFHYYENGICFKCGGHGVEID